MSRPACFSSPSAAAVLLVPALFAPAAGAQAPSPERPAVTLKSAEAAGVKVHYQTIPWGPQTFATMESPSDTFYNKRTWPFARLESSVAVTLEGTELPPGNYALVFHPASLESATMSLEVLKVEAGEFQQEGNVMARTPEGRRVFKGPVTFEKADETVPALAIALDQASGGVALNVAYGDRRLRKTLKR